MVFAAGADLDGRGGGVVAVQGAQIPVVLHGLHEGVMRVGGFILVASGGPEGVSDQGGVDAVGDAVGFRFVVGHHHGEVFGEGLVLEAGDPLGLEVGGDVGGVGIVAVVEEVGDVVPPLREVAAVDVLLEFGGGDDVGAAGWVQGDVLEVEGGDVLGGVGVGDPVCGFGGASAGVRLRVHLPAHAFFVEEVEDGGACAGEVVGRGRAVVHDPEGRAGDAGNVVGQGRVFDSVVLRQETVVVQLLDLLEGRVGLGGGIVGVLQHEKAPLLEVLAADRVLLAAIVVTALVVTALVVTALVGLWQRQYRRGQGEDGEELHCTEI